MNRSYKRHLSEIHKIVHEPNCNCKSWAVPINECTCHCYAQGIYMIGYNSGKIAGAQEKSQEIRYGN